MCLPATSVTREKKGEDDGEQNGSGKPGRAPCRPREDEVRSEIGVDRIPAGRGIGPLREQELTGHCKSMVPLMLQATKVEVPGVVEGGMILLRIADKGKVEST